MRVSDKPITDVSQIDEQAPRIRRAYLSATVILVALILAGLSALLGSGLQEVGQFVTTR